MITLRSFLADDKDIVREWRNSSEISRYMYTDSIISVDDHSKWFNNLPNDQTKQYWMILLDDERVGVANLAEIDRTNQRCFWAFYLASPTVRGRGVGGYVEHFVLDYVFEHLRLNKLCCEVLSFNEAVVQMHKQFGFKEEGVFRQHILKQGEFFDVIRLAMLRSEWRELAPGIKARLQEKGLL